MTATLLRSQHVTTALFVLMEAVAWWIALRGIGTTLTREGYASLVRRLEAVSPIATDDPAAFQHALDVARETAAAGTGGPSFLAVLLGAAGAFALVRWMVRQQLPVALSAVIGVAASLVAFQLLIHLALVGDLRVWEPLRTLRSSVGTQSSLAEVAEFVANPDARLPVRGALTTTVGGIALLWLRFLVAGRSAVSYERVLRSFSVGFAVLLAVAAWIALGEHVDIFALLPLYFVLGVSALAVAQAARARPSPNPSGRVEPWLVSLAVTLGALAFVALLFGVLSLADAGTLFRPVGSAVVWVVGRLAWLVLYPFAVVMEALLTLILGGRTLQFNQLRLDILDPLQPPPGTQQRDSLLPPWLALLLRTAAILFAGWALYRLGRLLFAARRRLSPSPESAPLRSEATAEPPRGLLRGLLRRRRTEDGISGAWLRRHAVYELFARVVRAARARGVERTPGSTPLEFAHDAGARLDAPPFEPIGRAFDAVRYGRHLPERSEVEAMERSLRQWEETHPAGEGDVPATGGDGR